MTPGPLVDSQARLRRRMQVIDAVRRFFALQDYLEVETPLRIPAPAPEPHIDPQPAGDWFLQASPELCMKRLLAAGWPRIFQICKCFRAGERGRRHLPELTMLEWYTAGQDYRHMMTQCEDLITFATRALNLPPRLIYQGREIDLTPPWPRISVAEAFRRHAGEDMQRALAEDRFDELMGISIEPRLGWSQPVILYDYPAALGALARRKAGQPELAERFELYIGGLELCNAFSELTDPREQRQRFETAVAERRRAGKATLPMPEPFLRDLRHMPPATGNAMGLDRLVMLFCDADAIDQVVAFTPEKL
ncbi:EF-P lysine aminoacylase EpmA [Desulfatitalea alkaliphila]|uniref:EF-P lysine aminoacylase EpmA n=1 Tax=Desulfatitalea alkaliphila TaxID=2929485 RepID=A0AA41R0D2_9BACT|nr:EF-P lysine aminoacylase EpmA [Desulfatitalea alkaliphila]MCJ8499864.1 EF-P lysine aminoacylase EpmA [Desulfatitalea alkaliphila]